MYYKFPALLEKSVLTALQDIKPQTNSTTITTVPDIPLVEVTRVGVGESLYIEGHFIFIERSNNSVRISWADGGRPTMPPGESTTILPAAQQPTTLIGITLARTARNISQPSILRKKPIDGYAVSFLITSEHLKSATAQQITAAIGAIIMKIVKLSKNLNNYHSQLVVDPAAEAVEANLWNCVKYF